MLPGGEETPAPGRAGARSASSPPRCPASLWLLPRGRGLSCCSLCWHCVTSAHAVEPGPPLLAGVMLGCPSRGWECTRQERWPGLPPVALGARWLPSACAQGAGSSAPASQVWILSLYPARCLGPVFSHLHPKLPSVLCCFLSLLFPLQVPGSSRQGQGFRTRLKLGTAPAELHRSPAARTRGRGELEAVP